jgi:RNA polymerase sigma-70 factor (ECF subfamily)
MNTKKAEDLSFLIEGAKSFSITESRSSYSALYKKYKAGIVHYVSGFTNDEGHIQDIVSESFAKAFSNMAMYKYQKANFTTWIYSIAKNTTIDWIRKGWINTNKQYSVSSLLTEGLIENFGTDYSNPMDKMGLKVFLKQVENEISFFPNEAIKNAFQLYIEGYPYEEISEKINMPLGTIKAYIHRMKTYLKEAFVSYKEELVPSFS